MISSKSEGELQNHTFHPLWVTPQSFVDAILLKIVLNADRGKYVKDVPVSRIAHDVVELGVESPMNIDVILTLQ
jgi:hypothetical protein